MVPPYHLLLNNVFLYCFLVIKGRGLRVRAMQGLNLDRQSRSDGVSEA